jgi:phosphatidylserine decarboxylase
MSPRRLVDAVLQQDSVNFVLTNRLPRRLATRTVGWFSRIEQPLVRDASIAVWRAFAGDLDLSEARKTRFDSLHDCFIRELRDGARPIDADAALVSPCDGIVVGCGTLAGTTLVQAKGSTYTLDELLAGARVDGLRDGVYVTLRLTSTMYHRFHAPDDLVAREVRYVPGELWNVNPPALARVPRLYCRNERAVVMNELPTGEPLAIVAVGAILVAGIHLHFLRDELDSRDRDGRQHRCRAAHRRGEEMGYFRHGSTIVVCAPKTFGLDETIQVGRTLRMGRPLMRRLARPAHADHRGDGRRLGCGRP